MVTSPNNDPIYISGPSHWFCRLNSQVMPRSGGTITDNTPVLLGTAGDTGGNITSIAVEAEGIVAENVAVLFVKDPVTGLAVKRGEVKLTQVASVSNTAIIVGYPIKFTLYDSEPFEAGTANFLKLAPNQSLYVALLVAETTSRFVIHATGGLYDQI